MSKTTIEAGDHVMLDNLIVQDMQVYDTFNTTMTSKRRLEDCYVKPSQYNDKVINKESMIDVTDSALVSTCCKTYETNTISEVNQVLTPSSTFLNKPFAMRDSVDPRTVKIIPDYNKSSSSSVFPQSSQFLLSTAGIACPSNVSSQSSVKPLLTASSRDLDLNTPTDPERFTFLPFTTQGLQIFTGAASSKLDQSNKRIDKTRARPSALRRPLNGRSKANTVPRNVTWSESITEVIDDITYEMHRKDLLNLHIPQEPIKSSVVEAVKFMCDTESYTSESLIDIAIKLFWLKHHRYPSSSELYTSVSDVNYDERCLILEYIKETEHTKDSSSVKLPFNNHDDISLPKTCDYSGSQSIVTQANSMSSKINYQTSVLGKMYGVPISLSDTQT